MRARERARASHAHRLVVPSLPSRVRFVCQQMGRSRNPRARRRSRLATAHVFQCPGNARYAGVSVRARCPQGASPSARRRSTVSMTVSSVHLDTLPASRARCPGTSVIVSNFTTTPTTNRRSAPEANSNATTTATLQSLRRSSCTHWQRIGWSPGRETRPRRRVCCRLARPL